MIDFDRLSYRYPGVGMVGVPYSLHEVTLHVNPGEFVLLVGPSGAGKSTLLRCLNGLVPHFYGGEIAGRIRVAGQDPVAMGPRRMSRSVGFVFQDPEAQAVTDIVEDELAFAMENRGLPPTLMRQRIEEVLAQLRIAHLRHRHLSSLSGGERQRVAIAATLTLRPRVLALDEPTSQLDPQAAEEVLAALVRLNKELGLTIVLAEHRLERTVQYADRIIYLPGNGRPPIVGPPREVLKRIPLVPPLIDLARRRGWTPLPLTVEEARKWLTVVKERQGSQEDGDRSDGRTGGQPPVLELDETSFAYDGHQALQGVSLAVRPGEFVALMGHNGAGKTTLLKHCIGLLRPQRGRVRVLGLDTGKTTVESLARRVGYVPQNPNALLFADTVADEVEFTRRARDLPPSATDAVLAALGLTTMHDRYPRDLSVGERQRVALAAVLVGEPELILLDEPTRGLDYEQKSALIAFLNAQRARKTVVVATHDVELVARCADRVVLLEKGRVIADGPMRQVLHNAPAFRPQINRLFRDPRYMTVEDAMEDT